MKNPIIKDHFLNPRNIRPLDNPTLHTIKKSDVCKDIVKLAVILDENEYITEISIEVYGCGYAIAGASLFSESVKGLKFSEALSIAQDNLKDILEDIPEKSRYCVTLSHNAFEKLQDLYHNEAQKR